MERDFTSLTHWFPGPGRQTWKRGSRRPGSFPHGTGRGLSSFPAAATRQALCWVCQGLSARSRTTPGGRDGVLAEPTLERSSWSSRTACSGCGVQLGCDGAGAGGRSGQPLTGWRARAGHQLRQREGARARRKGRKTTGTRGPRAASAKHTGKEQHSPRRP